MTKREICAVLDKLMMKTLEQAEATDSARDLSDLVSCAQSLSYILVEIGNRMSRPDSNVVPGKDAEFFGDYVSFDHEPTREEVIDALTKKVAANLAPVLVAYCYNDKRLIIKPSPDGEWTAAIKLSV